MRKMCSKNILLLTFLLFVTAQTICGTEKTKSDKNEIVFVEEVKQPQNNDNIVKLEEPIQVSDEVFVATNEWQTIKKNQAIPKGLHVRMNMQTGEREAKLLDDKDNKNRQQKQNQNPDGTKRMFSKELEEALLNLNDDTTIDGSKEDKFSDKEKKLKNKFRSYEKLKEELGHLNVDIKTDAEQIKSLLSRFNETTDKEERVSILRDLEYHVHKYDNGVLLCDLNGFEMIMKLLNSTDDIDLIKESVMVLGSAIQGNPKVKMHAVKLEFLQLILNRLFGQPNVQSGQVDPPTHLIQNNELLPKLMFTLSGLLRNFPFAQNQFIRFGGINILSNLIETSSSLKVKLKIITLANDLIQEKQDILNSNTEHSNQTKPEYQTINLIEELEKKNWCKHFDQILLEKNYLLDHDSREKIFLSMLNLNKYCHQKWSANKNVVNKLIEYRKFYDDLNENEKSLYKAEDDDAFNSLIHHDDYYFRLSNLIGEILSDFKVELKDEL